MGAKNLERALPLWAHENTRLEDPMIFLTGPRQVGKTHLTKKYSSAYFNWDTPEVKNLWLRDKTFYKGSEDLVIFDEIHKRRDWKKIMKGVYDDPKRKENFLVTGSGRFDFFQKGGDSLQGRYFSYQLFPLMPAEIHASINIKTQPSAPRDWKTWRPHSKDHESDKELIELGGFPAPFLKGSKTWLRRWQDEYIQRLTREDVRDLSSVQRLDALDLLARLLPERVGSPLSIQSLSEDIDVSHVATKSWLRILEILYLGFRIKPFHRKIHRAVKKEQKWYFYQWTFVRDPSLRFENYIATQLAAACAAWSEQGHGVWELCYLRDQDRREVDFVIVKDLKPQVLIEAKTSPQEWTSSLNFFTRKLQIPGILVYPEGPTRRVDERGWSLSSTKLLQDLIVKTCR